MSSLPDELARRVERSLCLPLQPDILRSTSKEVQLRKLSWPERRRAVRGAMGVRRHDALPGRAVLVVDDIVTSGATLSEAGRLLRTSGVTRVFAVTLAHSEV